jgi:hypothetical protein
LALLAIENYWECWEPGGRFARKVDADARADFRKLEDAFAAAGHPVLLGAFDWPFDADPRVHAARVDW